MLTFDPDGHVDAEVQQAQLRAEVDRLETIDQAVMAAPIEPNESATDWRPDSATRCRQVALVAPPTSYRFAWPIGA